METYEEIERLAIKEGILKYLKRTESDKEFYENEAKIRRETGKNTRLGIRDVEFMNKNLELAAQGFYPCFVNIKSIEYENCPPEFFDMLASFCQKTIDKCNEHIKKLEQPQ